MARAPRGVEGRERCMRGLEQRADGLAWQASAVTQASPTWPGWRGPWYALARTTHQR
jgi:hypothetical protein